MYLLVKEYTTTSSCQRCINPLYLVAGLWEKQRMGGMYAGLYCRVVEVQVGGHRTD